MATQVDLNIITGRTGTAHVSSADDAAIWRGLVGNSNVTLFTDQQLALNHQTKGKLVVSDGVLCIGGRMGRISNTKTVDYALPESGYYRRTLLVARYAISNNIESMTLLTLQNNPANDTSGADGVSSAAILPISTNASTDYVLYDFVCDADGVVSGTLKTELSIMDTIPLLRAALNAEQTARSNADIALGSRITEAEQNSRMKSLSVVKDSVTTRGVYFTSADGSTGIDAFLQGKRGAIIVFYSTENDNTRMQMVYIPFLNPQPSVPAMITIGSARTMIEFQILTDSAKLFLQCMTVNGDSYALAPRNYPFDAAIIYTWG